MSSSISCYVIKLMFGLGAEQSHFSNFGQYQSYEKSIQSRPSAAAAAPHYALLCDSCTVYKVMLTSCVSIPSYEPVIVYTLTFNTLRDKL